MILPDGKSFQFCDAVQVEPNSVPPIGSRVAELGCLRIERIKADYDAELLHALASSATLRDFGVSVRRGDFGGILLRSRGRHVGLWTWKDETYCWNYLASYEPIAFAAMPLEAVAISLEMARAKCWTAVIG